MALFMVIFYLEDFDILVQITLCYVMWFFTFT